jgi:O-antigen/teichoic acid export membrane protein
MNDQGLKGISGSLRDTAMRGGLWTSMQVVVNKATALIGTIVTMYLLTPDAFGIAAITTSILAYVALLPAFTLSDVLLARPSDAQGMLPTAFRLCAVATALTVAMLLVAGWIAARTNGDQRILTAAGLLAFRPVAELLLFAPQTRLRLSLDFGRMARIDAVAQSAATALSVAMAAIGAGYASLLVPQVLAVVARAALYSRAAGKALPESAATTHPWRRLLSDYGMSGLGQYVHGSLIVAPPLILAAYCDETTVGWYATAFALSTSFNTVVAVSIGLVLQPIFAQMGGDLERQRQAFVRACAIIAAFAMPVCLCQAACVVPAFALFMPEGWSGAAEYCRLMSAGQAFYFAVNPAMGLLKAQGRFGAFFRWQLAQLALVVALMVAAGKWAGDPGWGIILVFSFYHLVFSPIGIALCVPRGSGLTTASVTIFVRPLLASVGALAPPVAVFALIGRGLLADALSLAVVPAWALLTYPLLLRLVAPETHASFGEMAVAVRRRLSGAR